LTEAPSSVLLLPLPLSWASYRRERLAEETPLVASTAFQ
jgi:hypothetical protein